MGVVTPSLKHWGGYRGAIPPSHTYNGIFPKNFQKIFYFSTRRADTKNAFISGGTTNSSE
jgi:hypothetical protein